MEIKGKTAIVTGGASGLGKATAQNLIDSGAKVAIFDLNVELGEQTAEQMGKNAIFIQVDVADHMSVDNAVTQVLSEYGAIHIVVNCAGFGPAKKILGKKGLVSLDWFTRIVNANLVGTFNMVRGTISAMADNSPNEEGERGIYVNTASIAAQDGQIGQAAYSSSKGGIHSMTLTLAREFADNGIRVMAILPGIFDTPLMRKVNEETREHLSKQVPFPMRLGYAVEFAKLAAHIIENTYLNGESIRLDGALRMGFGRK